MRKPISRCFPTRKSDNAQNARYNWIVKHIFSCLVYCSFMHNSRICFIRVIAWWKKKKKKSNGIIFFTRGCYFVRQLLTRIFFFFQWTETMRNNIHNIFFFLLKKRINISITQARPFLFFLINYDFYFRSICFVSFLNCQTIETSNLIIYA